MAYALANVAAKAPASIKKTVSVICKLATEEMRRTRARTSAERQAQTKRNDDDDQEEEEEGKKNKKNNRNFILCTWIVGETNRSEPNRCVRVLYSSAEWQPTENATISNDFDGWIYGQMDIYYII